jgi:flagellar basal body P-ring protein FlgI
MKHALKFLVLALTISSLTSSAQTIHSTKTGQISFFSETPVRNIEAKNNQVASLINTETGEVVFSVLIKEFKFEKALMEEHFNENYMESAKYAKSTFQGKITNLNAVNFKSDGTYTVSVEGKLSMHGVTKPLNVIGKISVVQGKISVIANFAVQLVDFNIERPTIVMTEIAESVDVKINCQYELKTIEKKS